MITKKQLEKYTKEELIQLCLLRNDDAKDYSRVLSKRNAEVKQAIEKWWSKRTSEEKGGATFKELLQKLGLEDLK